MSKLRILVTGGGGYVGSVLVPSLIDLGYHVRVLDTFYYGKDALTSVLQHPNLDIVEADIRDDQAVKRSMNEIDVVIHLACISNDPSFELDPALGRSINYDATKSLYDIAVISGVQRFIYASSSSVYGVKKEKEVTEELSLEPLTDYSKYKALSEQYILNSQNPMTTVVLRPATVCGYSPRLRLDLTVNILTISALVKKVITVHGGNQTRPNIHIKDIVDCYIKFLTYPASKINHEIFNVGYENYSLIEIANMVKQTLHDNSIKIEKTSTNDNRSYRVSSKKIKERLGFIPQHTIEDAIRDLSDAFSSGLIPNALTDMRYYNLQTMKHIGSH